MNQPSHSYKKAPSLRRRYILLTVIMGLFAIAIVSISYQKLISTKTSISISYDAILNDQKKLVNVRNTLFAISKDINIFLLDPLNENLTKKIEDNTAYAQLNLTNLNASKHQYQENVTDMVSAVNTDFINLKDNVNYLVEYRLDINKQYPGLAIASERMTSQQETIKSGFEILINEIESNDIELQNPDLYPKLLKAYAVWIKAISQTRIYMANRLASFSTEIMDKQGETLKDFHNVFTQSVNELKILYTNEDSFEGAEILSSMQKLSMSWYGHFVDLRKISESDQWRSDTLILKTEVSPLITQITNKINIIEDAINNEKQLIDVQYKESDQTFNMLIFGIIGLFLFFIFAILTSMEWMIFTPIEKVTQALKSRAFRIDLPNIQSSKTQEVGELIDAFIEMNQEVTHRQNALEHQAMHDHLTGLPNRFLLNQRIEYQLLNAERQKCSFVLFLMDLDFFKEINDTLGHAAGDRLLIEVSKRIQNITRKSDTLARLGGDEFSILLPDTNKESASKVTHAIIDAINTPIMIDNQKVNIGISIGIVSYPEDGKDIETLLQYADMAMYNAKRTRAGFSFYDPSINIYSKTRLNFIYDVAEALENDEFEMYFQPQVSSDNQTLCGAEGLLRWNHKEHGFVSPEKVIEAAERTGIIHKLSICMLEKAITECRKWHEAGHNIGISVNLSVRDLSNKDLTDKVKELMDNNKLEYQFLTLEITESVMMENLALSLEVLNKLHDLGVSLSIDDFGTGFSSLAYLKRLPVNELKIDKSFIMEINEDANDKKIVSSTINLGHNLGLKVVAEGIETQKVMSLLQGMGCDQMQGYFIGKPMPKELFWKFLEESKD